MRLVSCYIEGYGKIKGQTYDFDQGVTVFCKENGEGKTTLASFIKAMFYGLESYKKNTRDFCDREHFYPFDGGLFGGNLTFEMGGQLYKIERFFGQKSETTDTLRVFENGEIIHVNEELGRWVFGVDKESFERTLFLDGGEVEITSTTGIHAKLNHFLEGIEDDGNLDEAVAALEKAAKVYKKSRAGLDKVSVETAKIAALNEDIVNARSVKLALEGKYARSNALRLEIERLSARIVKAQEENEKLSQIEHYESLSQRVEEAKASLSQMELRYPLGMPTLEETETLNAYMVRGKELQTRLEGAELSDMDKARLARLQGVFLQGVPSEETLLAIEGEIEELAKAEAGIRLEENRSRTGREEELVKRFYSSKPTAAQMSLGTQKIEEYKRTKFDYEGMPAVIGDQEKTPARAGKGYVLGALLALAIALLGGVLLAAQSWLGGVLLALGGVGLLADGFLYLNKKSSQATVGQTNPERARLGKALGEIEDSLKALLLPLGYHSGNGVAFDFATLQADLAAYEEYCARENECKTSHDNKRSFAAERTQSLTAFFREYGLAGDTFVKLSADLRSRIREYRDLSARRDLAGSQQLSLDKELQEIRAWINAFSKKYALQDINVSALEGDIRNALRLREEMKLSAASAAAYKAEKGLGERSDFVKEDLSELQAALQDKQSEKGRLDLEIADDERAAEKLDTYEAEKTEAEASLKEYKRKHALLTATAELLRQADGKLRDKYVKPIKDEFLYYAELLEKTLGEKVVMTKDFELRFERNGAERSEKHLSAGQRSICALCFRLALIKNMYRDQPPFLVLDDPFTSLDSGHVKKVASLLKELSKDMQMIYFTCHESRLI